MNMERPPPSPPSPPTAPMAPPAPSPAMFGHIYRLRGWSVFALPPGQKAPARPWKQFQTYRPSGHVIDTWFRQRPDSGIAVVTGTVSNLVVLDVDSAKHPDAAQAVADRCGGVLSVAPMVRTGSGGLHLYFSHPGGIVRNRVSVLPGVDLRGDGGFAVAPPSTHPCGQPYEWIADTAQLSPPPAWLISETAPRLFLVRQPEAANGNGRAPKLIHEGRRNPELFRIACALRGQGFDREFIESELMAINEVRCAPPLGPDEVAQIARSAARYPAG